MMTTMYVCMYVCVYVSTDLHNWPGNKASMNVCVHSIYVCMYVYTCMYVCMYVKAMNTHYL